jgi:hypothetical protein
MWCYALLKSCVQLACAVMPTSMLLGFRALQGVACEQQLSPAACTCSVRGAQTVTGLLYAGMLSSMHQQHSHLAWWLCCGLLCMTQCRSSDQELLSAAVECLLCGGCGVIRHKPLCVCCLCPVLLVHCPLLVLSTALAMN